jgi:L-2,4-diaminobutyrate decarboxylase
MVGNTADASDRSSLHNTQYNNERSEIDQDGEVEPLDGARMHRFDEEMDGVAATVVLYALDRVRLDPPPIDMPKTKAELDKLGPTVTPEGLGGMEALRLFCEDLAPATISQDHPRNISFVPSAPTEAAVLFDLVVGATSIYGGSWMEGSGAVWAENQALRWIADLVGLPEEAGGVFVSGGSAGNLSALVAARYQAQQRWSSQSGLPAGQEPTGGTRSEAEMGPDSTNPGFTEVEGAPRPPRWYVAVSQGAHSSIAAAARVMDIGVLSIPVDNEGRMHADGLRTAIAQARGRGIAVGEADRNPGFASDTRAFDAAGPTSENGRTALSSDRQAGSGTPAQPKGIVFAVVATSGTTNAGIIDDLAGVADVCSAEGLWMHVDGAYGGAALAAPSVRHKFNGIERADSFIVDPHKWLFAPYDCAALLYRNPKLAAQAHAQHAAYLDVLHDDGEWNPSDYAFHLTRRARGLPFWYSLATHGTDAYRDAIEASITLTGLVAQVIRDTPHLELLMEPDLSVLLFRRVGWSPAEYHAWSDAMLLAQRTFCVPTTVPRTPHSTPPSLLRNPDPDLQETHGDRETVLRFCFTNPRTTLADMVDILGSLA